jgi:hypothetical protein
MSVAHIMGIPVEENVLQLVPAATVIVTALAIAGRTTLSRLRRQATRHGTRGGRS